MGKKSIAATPSKISGSSALTKNLNSASSHQSSILKTSFTPSYLQLRLFASVIQSLDSQQLRIHDTTNGRLRQQHSVAVGGNVTCLDWGCYGPAYRENRASSKKKRKREHDVTQDVVVAYGTSTSDICMYSPSEGKLVGILKGHEREVKDFKFLPTDNLEAWSIGGDGKLLQWNLQNDQVVRSITLTDSSIRTLCSPSSLLPQIICASGTPFAVHLDDENDFRIESFDAFKQPVHTIFRSGANFKNDGENFLATDHNRYINVYNISSQKIVRTLVVGGDIDSAAINQPGSGVDQILAVVTRDGTIELFATPFSLPQSLNGDVKAKRKGLIRKADAVIKLVSSDGVKKSIPAFGAYFDGPNIIVGSIEGGVEPTFQKVRWQDEGSGRLLFEGMKEVSRAKSFSALNAATMSGAKDLGQTHVNEARAVVVNGLAESGSQAAPLEIESSDVDETEEESSDEGIEAENKALEESDDDLDEEMHDAEQDIDGSTANELADAAQEPSFGDLLAARHPETISIVDTLPADQNALTKVSEPNQMMLPSGMSLGTVLTQSLRTNDQSLLETCLHVTDEHVIQNTILRLDSSLAANLLTKLAERLADRPGRYGHLLTWVQSTMIAHGGAIASQAGVASKLRTLYQVLNERSRILPSILLLKGKLDMMNAQQSFRAQAEAHRKGLEIIPGSIYIEGQEENWSSDEDLDDERPVGRHNTTISQALKNLDDLRGDSESSDEEGVPMLNGKYDSEQEEDISDDNEAHVTRANGILDDEVEVLGEDDDDESGSDETNDDDEEEDSSMADFLNDGEISESQDENDIEIDEVPERHVKKSRRG